MKQIRNILSDALETAALIEHEYDIHLTRESSKRIRIQLIKRDTDRQLELTLFHDTDGYIRSVNVSQNTLLETNEYSYSAFLNAIYNEEYTYM